MADFDDILNYDPFLEAEKLTGESYKEDKDTEGVGFLLHIAHAKRKKEELALRGDTYWGMPYIDAVDVVLSAGFTPVWANAWTNEYGRKCQGVALWSEDGILVVMNGTSGTIGHIHMEFNWRPTEPGDFSGLFKLPISGGLEHRGPGFDDIPGDPWTGVASVYGDEGFLHRLAQLRASGELLREWYITDDLLSVAHLGDYENHDFEDGWHDVIKDRIRKIVSEFAEPARSAIQAGFQGKDWTK